MSLFPFSGFPELPTIDDISIQDQRIATVIFQETNGFPDMRIANAEMYVRQYDRPKMLFH